MPFFHTISPLTQILRPIRVPSDKILDDNSHFPFFSIDKGQEFPIIFTHIIPNDPDSGEWSPWRHTRATIIVTKTIIATW